MLFNFHMLGKTLIKKQVLCWFYSVLNHYTFLRQLLQWLKYFLPYFRNICCFTIRQFKHFSCIFLMYIYTCIYIWKFCIAIISSFCTPFHFHFTFIRRHFHSHLSNVSQPSTVFWSCATRGSHMPGLATHWQPAWLAWSPFTRVR